MRSISACLLIPLLTLFSQVARGVNWWAEPYLNLKLGYNDNINLTTLPHDDVFESTLTPGIWFGAAKETSGVVGRAQAEIQRFRGGDGNESSSLLDREYGLLSFDTYRNSESNLLGAKLELKQDDTLESAISSTGQVTDRVTRDTLTISPKWTRIISQKLRLSTAYNFVSVEFGDELPTSRLVEYDYQSLSGSMLYNFTSLSQLIAVVAYNKYEPVEGLGSDTAFLQGGMSHQFSEKYSGFFLAGVRRTTTELALPTGFCVGAPAGSTIPDCGGAGFVPTGIAMDETGDNGSVYSLSLTHTHETGTNELSVTRLSVPSIEGGLLDTLNITLKLKQRLDPTLSAHLLTTYSTSETIANSGTNQNVFDIESFRAAPTVIWEWSNSLSLRAGYEHFRSLNHESLNAQVATRNAVFVSFEYKPPRKSISR